MPISPPSLEQRLAARDTPAGHAVMLQRWSGLLFLHWPADAALIEERLPRGLHVDTFDGKAWVGVVPFFMDRVRPAGLPPVPWLSWFMELNVRTYVYDSNGNPGVWFFSLDCNQPIAVEIARRAFHLPYEHAAMSRGGSGRDIHYRCRRKTGDSELADYEYELPVSTEPAEPGSLEWFLVERYLLFSASPDGRLFCGRVHHAPYLISSGGVSRWSTEPLRLNGFSEPHETPSSVLTAAPVDVRIFPLREISR